MVVPGDYAGDLLLLYANGKVGRVPLSAYATKTNRRRLTGACSDKSPLVCVLPLREEAELALYTSEGRALLLRSDQLQAKTVRSTQGVAVLKLKPKFQATDARLLAETPIQNPSRYRVRSLPALGALLKPEDTGELQMTITEEE